MTRTIVHRIPAAVDLFARAKEALDASRYVRPRTGFDAEGYAMLA